MEYKEGQTYWLGSSVKGYPVHVLKVGRKWVKFARI